MNNGSPPKSRMPVLLLLVAALGGPAAAGLGFGAKISDRPGLAIALGIAYETVVLGFGFATKIWERLQNRWIDDLSEWLDGQVRMLLSNYEARYLKQLVYRHRTFDVKGLTTQSIHALEINQVFVELTVALQTPHATSADPIHNVAAFGNDGPRTVWEFLKEDKIGAHNLAILGAPGSGKTTLLRHVALLLAMPKGKRELKAIPILLFLRDYADSIKANPEISLLQIMHAYLAKMECPAPSGWLEHRLRAGTLLVMMDGLDEVADADTRRIVVSWVDRQIENNAPNRFVITSRPFGYRDNPLGSVTVLVVRPFSSEQVQRFVHNWYLANEIMSAQKDDAGVRLAAREGADDLLRRLKSTPALSDLAVNPLLLTMITTVHRYRSSLPGRRVELYAEICDVFLGKRQQARGLLLDLTPAQKKHVLAPLAYRMMCSRIREVTLSDAVTAISDSLQKVSPQSTGEGFLKMVENSSGLLLEREIGTYSFAHLTIQEYLAAVYIQTNQLEKDLVRQLGDSWWHETTRLYSAQADATSIISACLADVHPSVPLLTLAIECMEEAHEVQPSLRVRIETILREGVEDADPVRRKATAQAMLSLRARRMARVDEDAYLDTSRVTSAEYQLFLDAWKGAEQYHQPDHWLECHFPVGSGTNPVAGMRPSDAVLFCGWLTKQDQEGWTYDLPTDRDATADAMTEGSIPTGYWYSSSEGVRCTNISDPKVAVTQTMLAKKADLAANMPSRPVNGTDDDLDRTLNDASRLADDATHVFVDAELSKFAEALDQAVALAWSLALDPSREFKRTLGATLDRAHDLSRDPLRAVNIDRDLAITNELCQDIDRALFRSRAQDHSHTRALDFACLLFRIGATRRERQPRTLSIVRSSVSKAFFVLAALFLYAGPPDASRTGKKRQRMIDACLQLFLDSVILEERADSNIRASEGIRIAKHRRGRRSIVSD